MDEREMEKGTPYRDLVETDPKGNLRSTFSHNIRPSSSTRPKHSPSPYYFDHTKLSERFLRDLSIDVGGCIRFHEIIDW